MYVCIAMLYVSKTFVPASAYYVVYSFFALTAFPACLGVIISSGYGLRKISKFLKELSVFQPYVLE